MMKYLQLKHDERALIDYLLNKEKRSISYIAKQLGRSKSTISREIKRNSFIHGYDFNLANKKTIERQYHKHMMHILKYQEFTKIFLQYYDKGYHGIEATHNKIKSLYHNIKIPSWRQVYNWINDGIWIIKKQDRLRTWYKKGGKRTSGIFSRFKNKRVMPIWVRPKYIDKRQEYGHWEIDLIIGKKASGFENLLTLTERMTRETYVRKIKTKNPMKCNSEIYKLIKENNLLVKTITCDNGIEFEKIGLLASWLDIVVYFCEPYASYQRGSNENANGLIRRMYRKGHDFTTVSQSELILLQDKINNMPRKIFGWQSSNQIKQEIIR